MQIVRHLCDRRRFPLAGLHRIRHAWKPMLCLAVSTFERNPLHADHGCAASCGVGIELIDILPR
jgi:hypothetical protein